MLRRFAWGVLAYNLLVILWGAYVRASGSGAGCGSHWPTCNGEVVPRAETMETFVELTHRLTSGVALLLVVGLAVAVFRARPKGHPMRLGAVLSVVFMLLEAAVGAGLVLLELVADNQSVARAGWISVHLVNTFFLVAAMTLTAWWSAPGAKGVDRARLRLAWPLYLALVGTLVVGVTGAITALGDTLFPSGSLAEGVAEDFAPTAHFLVKLRVWHPVTAVVMGVFVTGQAVWAGVRHRTETTVSLAKAVAFLFGAQLVGGFVNLVLLAPTWMQLVHLLMADALWIALVLLTASLVAPRETSSA
ncbi:MAG: COX15/CtaA family protein [Sandaracinaceae bacterium]